MAAKKTAKPNADVHGVLCINKPPTLSSHAVVGKVRRLLGTRKVGHAGTLDPLASGLLIICVGRATKISNYLMGQDKVYTCDVVLGQATTTYDAQGEVTFSSEKTVTKDQVLAALTSFIGNIDQRPPIYSAIKKDGKKLYEYARKGQEVEVPVRAVRIDAIECLDFTYPRITLRVACSKGTYIRSIAHDLGEVLGVGGHAQHIHREQSGHFSLEQAVDWSVIEDQKTDQALQKLMDPLDALSFMPQVTVTDKQAQAIGFGQGFVASVDIEPGVPFVFVTDKKLIALGLNEDGQSQPKILRVM